jgi:hypothetical protein
MTARHALLGAVLALPLALLALAVPPGERVPALAATLPILAGLVLLDRVLRARVADGTAFWTIVLATYGTGLLPLLAHTPDARRAGAFLLGAVALILLRDEAPGSARRVVAFVAVILAGLALGGGWALDGPGAARAWFGSRDGLLFRTPLLWACLLGLAVLVRREGRTAVPLVVAGLLPFALAPIASTTALEVALPALLLGLGVGLDAVCTLLARRPAWALAAAVPLLATSNLLFMEQYRHTLRRDDTVSFPQVSEGSARLLSDAVGSPTAWPANWAWSAREGLPVERWDLLSGQRFRLGDFIDVGDLDHDATFLLDGWSVRHACRFEHPWKIEAICRQVEGRAELVVPMEREVTGELRLYAVGSGSLRVWLNGEIVDTMTLPVDPWNPMYPRPTWRRGVNRVVLESVEGVQLVDGLEVRSILGPQS